jgi:archaellum component FlaC
MEQHLSIIISSATLITLLLAFKDRIFRGGKTSQQIDDKLNQLEKKDAQLDVCIGEIKGDIKSIKENHLEHIQQDISKINVNLGEINTALKFIIKEK